MGDVVDEVVGHILRLLLPVERVERNKSHCEGDDEEDENHRDDVAHALEDDAADSGEVDDQVVRGTHLLVVFQQKDELTAENLLRGGALRRDHKLRGEGVVEREVETVLDVLVFQCLLQDALKLFLREELTGCAVELDKVYVLDVEDVGDVVLHILRIAGVVVLGEQPTVGRREILRVVGNDARIVLLEINRRFDDPDGLIVHAVDEELARLLHGDDPGSVDLLLVHTLGIHLEQGVGVVLDDGVNAVHSLVARRQHFIHKDAALHLLGLRVKVQNTDNQRDGGQPDQDVQCYENAFFHFCVNLFP